MDVGGGGEEARRRAALESHWVSGEGAVTHSSVAQERGLPQLPKIIAALKQHLITRLARREPVCNDPAFVCDPERDAALLQRFDGYSLCLEITTISHLAAQQLEVWVSGVVRKHHYMGSAGTSLHNEILAELLFEAFPGEGELRRVLRYFLEAHAPCHLPPKIKMVDRQGHRISDDPMNVFIAAVEEGKVPIVFDPTLAALLGQAGALEYRMEPHSARELAHALQLLEEGRGNPEGEDSCSSSLRRW